MTACPARRQPDGLRADVNTRDGRRQSKPPLCSNSPQMVRTSTMTTVEQRRETSPLLTSAKTSSPGRMPRASRSQVWPAHPPRSPRCRPHCARIVRTFQQIGLRREHAGDLRRPARTRSAGPARLGSRPTVTASRRCCIATSARCGLLRARHVRAVLGLNAADVGQGRCPATAQPRP